MQNLGHHIVKLLSFILFALLSITGEFAGGVTDCAGSGNPKVAVARQQYHAHKVSSSSQAGRSDVLPPGNHIRVRYKASYLDCHLPPVVFVLHRPVPVYAVRSYPALSCPLVFLAHQVSDLRGPPSFVA